MEAHAEATMAIIVFARAQSIITCAFIFCSVCTKFRKSYLSLMINLHKNSPVISVITLAFADAASCSVTSWSQHCSPQLLL